jgi:hypothetical protein
LLVGGVHLRHISRLHGTTQTGARVSDGDEDGVLLLGHTLHCVDQVGNQIRAPLQLGLDLSLRLIHPFVHGLNLIVSAAGHEQGRYEEGQMNPGGALHH